MRDSDLPKPPGHPWQEARFKLGTSSFTAQSFSHFSTLNLICTSIPKNWDYRGNPSWHYVCSYTIKCKHQLAWYAEEPDVYVTHTCNYYFFAAGWRVKEPSFLREEPCSPVYLALCGSLGAAAKTGTLCPVLATLLPFIMPNAPGSSIITLGLSLLLFSITEQWLPLLGLRKDIEA